MKVKITKDLKIYCDTTSGRKLKKFSANEIADLNNSLADSFIKRGFAVLDCQEEVITPSKKAAIPKTPVVENKSINPVVENKSEELETGRKKGRPRKKKIGSLNKIINKFKNE